MHCAVHATISVHAQLNHIFMSMGGPLGPCLTHIKVTGVRCDSPALEGEQFCYFHQNAIRTVRRPKQSRLHPIALIEDEESIQYALMEVINALMKNTIDLKRATLILRALHIAVKNASRVKFDLQGKHSVTEIPDYAPPPEEHEEIAGESELPAVAANPSLPVSPEGPHFWEMQAEAARRAAREDAQRFAAEAKSREEARADSTQPATPTTPQGHVETATIGEIYVETAADGKVNVGTAALGCPGRAATERAAQTTDSKTTPSPAATSVSPHNFKRTAPPETQPTHTHATPSARKPPQPSTTRAPKEHKNAAHAARHG